MQQFGFDAQSTVFIIDGDEVCRNATLSFLRSEGLRCRGFPSSEVFLKTVELPVAGCVVTDVTAADLDAVALVGRLRALGSHMPVIILAEHADVAAAVRAMKSGAADFIDKPFDRPFDKAALLEAVRECLGELTRTHAEEAEKAAVERRRSNLTRREAEVFEHLIDGRSNKDIARLLALSCRTVEVYRMKLMSKMNAENVADLVRMAFILRDGRSERRGASFSAPSRSARDLTTLNSPPSGVRPSLSP